MEYHIPLERYNFGEFRIVALLVDRKTNANIAEFGYDNELVFKIDNHGDTRVGGLFKNQGKLKLIK
jgi:hypothetical protein